MIKHPAFRASHRVVGYWFNLVRLSPFLVLWRFSANRGLIDQDVCRWGEAFLGRASGAPSLLQDFLTLMSVFPEYRSLYYYRVGGIARPFWFLCPPLQCMLLHAGSIGPGLVLQHGIGAVIVADKIGSGCWINQQVTLGVGPKPGFPTLGDEVGVGAGAKVLGGVVVGDRARIGANAVVVKDVPPDVTVVGVPAYIVRRNGVRVHEEL
ncbi:serine O-acetyltransferase [Paludisphaera rhizosphaerae]|uniref:serine O-acetyltransferase n=1 Tax=Paludisphaera rhizosphaerae TaxID=2711216 RepID=UPI0013ED3009|nr:serine acetyltransferase [Paludisphaera rhizosphaerae]